jgi:hypothetical protein
VTDHQVAPTICVDKMYITFEVDDGVVDIRHETMCVIGTTRPQLVGWEVKFFGGGFSEITHHSSLLRTPFKLQ